MKKPYLLHFGKTNFMNSSRLFNQEEATLKTLRHEGQMIRLDPANRQYDPQRYRPEQVVIQGRLAGLLRRY